MLAYRLDELKTYRNKMPAVEFAESYGGACLLGSGMLRTHVGNIRPGETAAFAADASGLDPQNAIVGRVFLLRGRRRGHLEVTVGRDAQNDVVIVDFPVSAKHCSFIFDLDHWVVIDRGSTNGTWVNGVRLSEGEVTYLTDGAHVGIGRYIFKFFASVLKPVGNPAQGGRKVLF